MTDKNKKNIPEEKRYPEAIVGAIVVSPEGKILLAPGQKWGGKYCVFGGHIELGETINEAIVREMKEEADIDVKVVDSLGFGESIQEKSFYREMHFVYIDLLCSYDGPDEAIKLNDEYSGAHVWIDPKEALKLDLVNGTRKLIEKYLVYLESKEYLSGWKRCQADFENYKKRQAGTVTEMARYANQGLILEIIPVLDNFHASTDHVPEDQRSNAWVTGIMHIQKQLEQVLKDNGVSEIDAKAGDNFDPKFHEAIDEGNCVPCDDRKKFKNKIKKVARRGYKIGDRIIRPTRVVVE